MKQFVDYFLENFLFEAKNFIFNVYKETNVENFL